MPCACLDRAGIWIIGIYVVAVNQPAAFSDRRAKEQANGALLAREFPEGALVVCGSVHFSPWVQSATEIGRRRAFSSCESVPA